MSIRFIITLLLAVIIPLLSNTLFEELKSTSFSTGTLITIIILLIFLVVILEYLSNEKSNKEFDKLKSTILKREDTDLFPNVTHQNTLTEAYIDVELQTRDKKSRVSLKDLINTLYRYKDQVFIIQGDAGLGKSTLLRYLVKTIAQKSISKKRTVVPFLIILSEFSTLDDEQINQKLDDFLSIPNIENISPIKFVFCLDGFNEIKEESFIKILGKLTSFCERKKHLFCLMISIRPFFLKNCIKYLSKSIKINIFQIKKWSSSQIQKYLTTSNKNIHFNQIPENIQKLLDSPFVASIYLQQSLKPSKNKIERFTDLMENYLDTFFFPEYGSSEYNQIINISKEQNLTNKIFFEELAYLMTNEKTLLFSKDLLIRCSSKTNVENDIELLLRQAENFGLILSIDDVSAEKNYKFRHQIIQEYLCALYIQNDITKIPQNASSDIYWKDVPVYMFNLLNSDSEKELFIQKLIDCGNIHTVAVILNRFPSENYINYPPQIMNYIILNLKKFDSYPWSDDVVRMLSPYSEEILLNEIKKIDKDTIAPEELHSDIEISPEQEIILDENWRLIGRSIAFITESNSLLKTLLDCSIIIESEHLKYHILEYILKSNTLNTFRDKFNALRLTHRLAQNSKNEIINLYKLHIYLKSIGLNKKVITLLSRNKWNYTLQYVKNHCDNSHAIFYLRNFWIRNHGIECLSNYIGKSDYSKFSEIIIHILELEETFSYPNHKPFYFAIHKSTLISLNKLDIKNLKIKEIIRSLLRSKRLTNSDWAIKYLKTLIYRFDSYDSDFLNSLGNDSFISQDIKNIIEQRKEFL
jgi:hypothetical protein